MGAGAARWPGTPGSGRPLVLAHRGGRRRTDAPGGPTPPGAPTGTPGGPTGTPDVPWENTLAAFEAARSAGADGVELDVRADAAGTLVVHHDDGVPGLGPVHLLPPARRPRWMPTLADALDALAGLTVDIEVKAPPAGAEVDVAGVAGAVVQLLADRPPPTGRRWLLSSFWPDGLRAAGVLAAATGTPVDLGLLVHPAVGTAELLPEARRLGCAVILPPWTQVTTALVEEAHGQGMGVVAWTVNGAEAFAAVAAAGVDAVVTDDVPDALDHRRRWFGDD